MAEPNDVMLFGSQIQVGEYGTICDIRVRGEGPMFTVELWLPKQGQERARQLERDDNVPGFDVDAVAIAQGRRAARDLDHAARQRLAARGYRP